MINDNRGFSLLEVVIALTIFSVFFLAFFTSQGFNIATSTRINDSATMHTLADRIINEELLNPPQFTEALDNEVKTEGFKEPDYQIYTYRVEYKKIKIPNLSQITGQTQENQQQNDPVTTQIFEKIKINMERMLWQLRVTITNTNNNTEYELTTWVTNNNAQMDLNFGL
jgi:prepilin-type N-terminal cleavage/methylation domain-containing protein